MRLRMRSPVMCFSLSVFFFFLFLGDQRLSFILFFFKKNIFYLFFLHFICLIKYFELYLEIF
jgi:hypothetical protein